MEDTQCFACLSDLQGEVKSISKRRAEASTLNNFQIEIKDLLKLYRRLGAEKYNNDKKLNEQLQELAVCTKCLACVKLIVASKYKVDKVENTVRKLQVDLLKHLKKLEKCLEELFGEMEALGGTIQTSCGGSGTRQTADLNGPIDNVWNLRKDILDVVKNLQLFRNGIRTSTTASSSEKQKKSSNSSGIPSPQISIFSIKIKTEQETTNLNPDENPDNLLDYADEGHIDSPSNQTEVKSDVPPPEINPDSSSQPPKSFPVTNQIKWSRLPNKCTNCSKSFKLKSDLQKHRKIQHPNDRLKETVSCTHCHESMSRQLLRTHKLHQCPSLKKNIFPCLMCKETFSNVDLLKDHNLEIHTEKLKNMCEICGKISASRHAKEMHQNTHEDPRNRQVVECEDCGKTILATSISTHKSFGCPKRENCSFLCKFCQKYYSNESYLDKHVVRMHKGQQTIQGVDEVPDKLRGHKRKIKVIAEEDNHTDMEDLEDKPEANDMDDSSSDYFPSEDEINKTKKRLSLFPYV